MTGKKVGIDSIPVGQEQDRYEVRYRLIECDDVTHSYQLLPSYIMTFWWIYLWLETWLNVDQSVLLPVETIRMTSHRL